MRGIDKLKSGDFNTMSQEAQADSSVIITLASRRYPERYRIRVKDLYGPAEEILDEEITVGGKNESTPDPR